MPSHKRQSPAICTLIQLGIQQICSGVINAPLLLLLMLSIMASHMKTMNCVGGGTFANKYNITLTQHMLDYCMELKICCSTHVTNNCQLSGTVALSTTLHTLSI
jgi:hypothetical protein